LASVTASVTVSVTVLAPVLVLVLVLSPAPATWTMVSVLAIWAVE
jgi:hypothetical protein